MLSPLIGDFNTRGRLRLICGVDRVRYGIDFGFLILKVLNHARDAQELRIITPLPSSPSGRGDNAFA